MAQLDYAVNRSYASGQGRFTSVDPIGMSSTALSDPQSLNLYAYVGNNPINFVDPTGLKWVEIQVCELWSYFYINEDGSRGDEVDPKLRFQKCHTEIAWLPDEPLGVVNIPLEEDPVIEGGTKIPQSLVPDHRWNVFDDCQEMTNKILEWTANLIIRRGELDRDTESYVGHANVWADHKNHLSELMTKYKGNNCNTLSNEQWQEAYNEATASAPPIQSYQQFQNSNGEQFIRLLLCGVNPAFCVGALKPGKSKAPNGPILIPQPARP